jgi:hypothetical protein
MAQVGQKVNVCFAKLQAACHGRKHRAKAFAVAAGVADFHLAGYFGLGRCQGQAALGQMNGLAGQRFKLLHGWLL